VFRQRGYTNDAESILIAALARLARAP